LAKLLSIDAFRDHRTIEELFTVVPPGHAISYNIPWRGDLLDEPFFLSPTREGSIETAGAFSKRNDKLGYRAGFPEPPTMHDWRANALFLIGRDANLIDFVYMG
jgi:hypothetical protein